MAAWYKFDGVVYPFPSQINDTEYCYFARDYIGGRGYSAGETNDLILNFKQSISRKNTKSWQYRNWAVQVFANELASIFKEDSSLHVTNIPTSKSRRSAGYDYRFEDMFDILKIKRPNLRIIYPLDVATSVTPSHLGGSRSTPTIQANLTITNFPSPHPNTLVLVDDVVTTGSHFRACVDALRQFGFTGNIIGVFWARTI